MTEFIVATCLEFEDRLEGQILHVGDEESCQKTSKLISAISYSGNETILSSRLLVIPNDHKFEPGQLWRHEKTVQPERC